MNNSIVVKFDGIDGCGKTTLVHNAFKELSNDFLVGMVKEFGDAKDYRVNEVSLELSLSEVLRLIAKCNYCDLDDIERELLWSVISRRTNRIIIPKMLPEYQIILVDRSNLGNLAYGLVLDNRLEVLYDIANNSSEIADIIFWIDTPVEICEKRLTYRNRDIIEQKGEKFFYQVREKYMEYYKKMYNVIRLDGALNERYLTKSAINIIKKRLIKK